MKNNLFGTVERGKIIVKIILLLTRATLWGSPQLNWIDGHFKVDNAYGESGGHRQTENKHQPRPPSTDCQTTKYYSLKASSATNPQPIHHLQVPQAVKKDSNAFSIDAPACSMKDPSTYSYWESVDDVVEIVGCKERRLTPRAEFKSNTSSTI